MKKILLTSVLFLSMILLLTSCSFFGISCEQAEKNLKDAGYNVTVMDGSAYVDSDDCLFPMLSGAELEYYLYAEKGEDKIYMFFFYFTEQAESNYDFMNMNDRSLRSGMNNGTVYFGTKQAVKDSNI